MVSHIMLDLHTLSTKDIKAIRQSWGLAKDAAPFEVHGPAFYKLWVSFNTKILLKWKIYENQDTLDTYKYKFGNSPFLEITI